MSFVVQFTTGFVSSFGGLRESVIGLMKCITVSIKSITGLMAWIYSR